MRDIERHIGDIEARNMASFPSQYDRMITSSPQTFEDIEMIDLGNFLE